MRKVVIRTYGGPEVLELTNVPDPSPDDHELLIDVEAIGVNFRDVRQRRGDYPGNVGIAGEGAGIVIARGRAVRSIAIGERVAWPVAR
jgi:NADPH2:quinone reductase